MSKAVSFSRTRAVCHLWSEEESLYYFAWGKRWGWLMGALLNTVAFVICSILVMHPQARWAVVVFLVFSPFQMVTSLTRWRARKKIAEVYEIRYPTDEFMRVLCLKERIDAFLIHENSKLQGRINHVAMRRYEEGSTSPSREERELEMEKRFFLEQCASLQKQYEAYQKIQGESSMLLRSFEGAAINLAIPCLEAKP